MRLPILFLLLCLLAPPAVAGDVLLHAGSYAIHAELAMTPEEREQGLMRRATLCADCGMLFVFPVAGPHNFWMKNTPLPLSIAFVSADGHILNIEEMQPETEDIHGPRGDALYALEMNRGWFTRHRIKPGDLLSGIAGLTTHR